VAKREVYQPSMGSALNNTANFFEDTVTADSLSYCYAIGDEDFGCCLMADVGPSFYMHDVGPSFYMHDVTITPTPIAAASSAPQLPRQLKTLIDEISPRYRPWPNDPKSENPAKLVWMVEVNDALTHKCGLHREVANLLTRILGQWCWAVISQRRQRMVHALLADAKSVEVLRAVLANLPPSEAVSDAIQFIDATLANLPPSEAVSDAIQLVDAALANAPRKTWSWFKRKSK
jgi:hypothetical protein